ncbi:MAG: hypothetical protein ACNI26_07790 [Terasakiella sp.]|uniref:hypothetical protein n=1 Tax=unclassified Terasakiella TaxID=2614952 RepID=UPI003B00D464
MKFLIFVSLFTLAHINLANADPINDPSKWMDNLCKEIIKDEAKGAKMVTSAMDFGNVQSQSQIASQELAFKGAFEQAKKFYGKLETCSYGNESAIGEDLKKVAYVAKYAILPTILEGYFVKGSSGWKVFGVSFLDQKKEYPFK